MLRGVFFDFSVATLLVPYREHLDTVSHKFSSVTAYLNAARNKSSLLYRGE